MLLMSESTTKIVAIVACVLFVILLAILIFVLVRKGKNNKGLKVDDALVTDIVTYLGGKENIKNYKNDGSRVRFEIENLGKVNLNGLKSISKGGVFITGLTVKVPFDYKAEEIIKMLDKVLK